MGAFLICDLVQMVIHPFQSNKPIFSQDDFSSPYFQQQMASSDDLDNDIDELLNDFEANCQRSLLHCVLFY